MGHIDPAMDYTYAGARARGWLGFHHDIWYRQFFCTTLFSQLPACNACYTIAIALRTRTYVRDRTVNDSHKAIRASTHGRGLTRATVCLFSTFDKPSSNSTFLDRLTDPRPPRA